MKNNSSNYSKRPLKLKSMRVWRTYSGGKLIDELHGLPNAVDCQFPEDWVASLVIARNPGREHIQEGLSILEMDGEIQYTLKELIDSNPEAFLGKRHVQKFGSETGMLVKILDAAERLTIQVHPDQANALKLFNSRFGKNEAWYILGGREINGEPPYVLLGFKPGVTREIWEEIFKSQDIDRMLDALHKFYVKSGDTLLIEGGIPHAIGAGCFLVEIQEPTDYTIRTEKKTPNGMEVLDQLCHQGLGFNKMFDCFGYEGLSREDVLKRWAINPTIIRQEDGGKESSLITYDRTDKFAMNLIEVNSEIKIEDKDSFSVLLVVSGDGALRYENEEICIKQGNQIFLPINVKSVVCINKGEEPLKVIRCFPPLVI
jgi:mannose-6-phosphate isomerase